MQPDYSRQLRLREVGAAGQAALARARVLIVGAGGLGSPVLQYLAGAGIGTLGIIDGDTLEASNLHRQPLYSRKDVGRAKVQLAAAAVHAINPSTALELHATRLTAENALALVSRYDVTVDCTDNFRAKYLINDAAVLSQRAAVFASVYQYEGQLQVYKPEAQHACLRCLWPEATADGVVGNCAETGVLGPVPGAIGSLQALLALKIVLGMPGQLDGELLLLDFSGFATHRIRTARRAACAAPGCTLIRTIEPETEVEIELESLAAARAAGLTLLDIRDDEEVRAAPSGLPHVPMPQLLADPARLPAGAPLVLVCATGKRSLATARTLARQGFAVRSAAGGLDRLQKQGSH